VAAMPLTPTELSAVSSQQLDRVLGFFARVESKATALFAVDLGMVGFMATKINLVDLGYVYVPIVGIVTLALLSGSIFYIYWTFYPDLHQGESTSSVFFGYIAKLPREKYINHINGLSQEEHVRDTLDQVWRNSDILQKKFSYIKKASLATLLGVPFWVEFLVLITLLHSIKS
jgi:hypothetical protein